MDTISMEELSAAAGVALSLGFSYIPGLQETFNRLEPTYKRLVMLALLALAAGAAYALGCLGLLNVDCSQAGAWGLLRTFLAAVIANQAAFSISPAPRAVPLEPTTLEPGP